MTRIGVVVFPGSNCEYDAAAAVDPPRCRGRFRLALPTDLTGIRRRHPARRFRPRRLPATRARSRVSRRSWTRSNASPPTAVRSRHLQRLPGARRGRSVARRAAEESRSDVPLPADDARRHLDVVGADAQRERSAKNSSCRSTTSRAPTRATTRPTTNSEANGQIVLRYKDNPNGSRDDIAGVANERGQRRRTDAAPRARDVDAARQCRRRRALRRLLSAYGPTSPRSRIEAPSQVSWWREYARCPCTARSDSPMPNSTNPRGPRARTQLA